MKKRTTKKKARTTRKVVRSSISGHFAPKSEATRHPDSTTTETVRAPRARRRSK